MAFNPQIGDTGVPNMTGASQGQIPDRSFENLFEGLTKTFENVTEIKDTGTQLDIRDQADKMFEDVNTEFGVAAPTGLTDELDKMSGLQAALTQGKISQVNYYGRLATLSKQLRSKYPGYEHIVDATIQSVTGTRPANAYRDAIFQQISDLQEGASSEEKFRRQWTKENEGVLFSIFGEDYFNNPDKYDFNKVQSEVARWKGRAEVIESETKALDYETKLGNRNDTRAAKQIDRDFSFVVESTLNRSLGLNQPSAMDKINQFVAAGGGTPQELDQVIVQLSELEATTRAELMKKGRQNYVSSGLVSAEAMNKAVEQAMYPITQAKQAILGGDFKLAARYATIAKAQTDQQLNEMLKDPTFRTGQGLTEINQTLGDEFFTRNYEAAETAALEVTGRTIAGQPDVIKNVMSDGNSKLAVPILQNSFKAIVDPKLTGDKFSNVIDQFFGPQAFDFMSPKNVSPEDLETLYLQFLRPEVTKAIFTRGSEQDKQKYVDWAMTKAVAIPSFRAAAGDLVSLQNQADGMFDLQFDPQSMRLGANFKGFTMSGQRQTIGKAVDSFNKVMSVLKPIWDAEGIDGQVAAKQFVQQMSISLENTNPANAGGRGRMSDEGKPTSQTFWGSIWDALMKPIGDLKSEDSSSPQEQDFSSIDFLDETEQYDILDESYADVPEPRPESQALGFVASQPRGLESLVTSRKRGYNPDIQNLRPDVVSGLQELQSGWGRALPIVSGYRDPERNRKAGGAKKSQHMHGKAVDIDVSNLSREERIQLIKLARAQGWGGIGVYPNSLHIDKGAKRAWGPSYKNTSLPKWAREALGG